MDRRAFLDGAAAFLAAALATEKQRPPHCVAFLTLNPRLRMSSMLSLFLAMWLVGCGGMAAVPAGTASVPPPLVARVHPDFWSAVAALDFDGAERLAASAPQVEFLGALRDIAEERLVMGWIRLLALAPTIRPSLSGRTHCCAPSLPSFHRRRTCLSRRPICGRFFEHGGTSRARNRGRFLPTP